MFKVIMILWLFIETYPLHTYAMSLFTYFFETALK